MHPNVIWIVSSGNVLIFFMIENRKVIYPSLFAFNFSSNVLALFFNVFLASNIERKIMLVGDVYFRPPIIIKFHDLHVGDIRRVVGEIASYHERD
jgi:hypothetical protein